MSQHIDKADQVVKDGSASRVGLTPSPTCLPGQGGSRKGMRPFGNETGRANRQPSSVKPMEGLLMSKKRETKVASDGGPELRSAGVPWSEVPEFARPHVAWIDGRHGSAQSSLPPVDVVPVPDILYTLPYLHELPGLKLPSIFRSGGPSSRCA